MGYYVWSMLKQFRRGVLFPMKKPHALLYRRIIKLAKAYDTMLAKGASTTLVQKRRHAVKVAIACLLDDEVSEAEAQVSCEVLINLLPAINTQLAKAKQGSSQHTLNTRRLRALQLAIQKLNQLI